MRPMDSSNASHRANRWFFAALGLFLIWFAALAIMAATSAHRPAPGEIGAAQPNRAL